MIVTPSVTSPPPDSPAGLLCHLNDDCASNPCHSGAKCYTSPINGTYKCHCETGYMGNDCSEDLNECEEGKRRDHHVRYWVLMKRVVVECQSW